MIEPSRRFLIPGRVHPGYSLLGRLLRRRLGDPLRAEAYHVVLLSAAGVVWLLGQYGAWAVVRDAVLAAPTGPVAVTFFAGQVASLTLLFLTGFLGFEPPVSVACEAGGVRIRKGEVDLYLPLDHIEAVVEVPARTYHRHYRRYAATRAFVNRPGASVLLIETPGGPVALGLEGRDADALRATLAYRREWMARPVGV